MIAAVARSYRRHVLRDTYRLYVTGLIAIAIMCLCVYSAPGNFLNAYGDMELFEQFQHPAGCLEYTADCEIEAVSG